MTETYDAKDHFSRFPLPEQDLRKFTFCNSSKASRLQDWIDQLHITRTTQTSAQLYKYLPQISRLKTDPKTRLEMLEVLRPAVQIIVTGLAKEFLGRPLILPEPAQKAAIVAQALQKTMIEGYSVCVRDLTHQKSLNSQAKDTLTTAIHRAISGIGLLYLRSCQIYTQIPKNHWLHLHQLFCAAEHAGLATTPVQDDTLKHGQADSIRHAYLRIIMLACSGANQISQQDVTAAFNAFEAWAQHLKIRGNVDLGNENQFVINLSRDEPPCLKKRFNGDKDDHLLELDFTHLITALEWQKADGKMIGKRGIAQASLSPGLISHLNDTWGETIDRQQHRRSVKEVVEICVGLTECHYHLTGGTTFDSFLKQFARRSTKAIEALTGRPPSSHTAHTPIEVAITDFSAGGYCLYWQTNIPSNVTAGQLLGIRGSAQEEWQLGVVRWIRQFKGASQMGVQIVALEAEPVASAVRYTKGGWSDVMRGLLVALPTSDQTMLTLITPAAPFQTGSKLRLKTVKETRNLKLEQCILATNSVRQFTFRDIDPGHEWDMDVEGGTGADLDIWGHGY